jgi:prepilin-type N-terminal cleavage/methylation domain-containing protein
MGKGTRTGFTLVEMLVVIGIIGILVTIMVPIIGNVREKAKEGAVKTYCGAIEQALSSYAASHDGNFPGVAIDVMAPYPDHALGDPMLYAGQYPLVGGFAHAVIGGKGANIPSTAPALQLLKQVRDTVLDSGTMSTERWFDALIISDALSEYPQNPFRKSGLAGDNRMMNVFCFEAAMPAGPNDMSGFRAYILANPAEDNTGTVPDMLYTNRVRITANWDDRFGNDLNNTGDVHNAAGDFAYVPILSMSSNPFVDNPMTPEDDRFRWGTNVTGYLLFGFSHPTTKTNLYQEEKDAFRATGLDGFGGAGCDTPYEQAALALFDSAVYFSRIP